MIEALNDLIGTTYETAPIPWLLSCLIIMWALYMVMTFIYVGLGLNK